MTLKGLKRSKCRGCGKAIVWAETSDGKKIPLDPTPPVYRAREGAGHGEVIATRHPDAAVTHFATCPKAADFSRGARK